jgi:VanZ family protein
MPVAMTMLFRLFAWLLAAAVTFVTLGPPQYRPHAHLGQAGEHALAFVLVGLAFGLAYPRQRRLTALIAVMMTGTIEIMQFGAPGRHARLMDFVVDALAACIGLAAAATLDRMFKRTRPQVSQ